MIYPLLKEAYLNIPINPEDEAEYSSYDSYRDAYLLLFIQNFFNEALKDETIRDKMLYKLDEFCNASFPRDIIKTTIDLFLSRICHLNHFCRMQYHGAQKNKSI